MHGDTDLALELVSVPMQTYEWLYVCRGRYLALGDWGGRQLVWGVRRNVFPKVGWGTLGQRHDLQRLPGEVQRICRDIYVRYGVIVF